MITKNSKNLNSGWMCNEYRQQMEKYLKRAILNTILYNQPLQMMGQHRSRMLLHNYLKKKSDLLCIIHFGDLLMMKK